MAGNDPACLGQDLRRKRTDAASGSFVTGPKTCAQMANGTKDENLRFNFPLPFRFVRLRLLFEAGCLVGVLFFGARTRKVCHFFHLTWGLAKPSSFPLRCGGSIFRAVSCAGGSSRRPLGESKPRWENLQRSCPVGRERRTGSSRNVASLGWGLQTLTYSSG